jgi:hypothetical protein
MASLLMWPSSSSLPLSLAAAAAPASGAAALVRVLKAERDAAAAAMALFGGGSTSAAFKRHGSSAGTGRAADPRAAGTAAAAAVAAAAQAAGAEAAAQAAQGRLLVLRNRAPRWCGALGAYTLHFNGRVTEASVKNFQLEAVGGPGLWATKGAAAASGGGGGASAKARGGGGGSSSGNGVVLQFGRVSADAFTLDYAWPMTPVQAFAIALTSLDQKIAVE